METAITEYLRSVEEPLPAWLEGFRPGDSFPVEDFLSSRIVYYPGSGTDGHAVQVFNAARAAHCFVYADYGLSRHALLEGFERHPFKGYHALSSFDVEERELTPAGWRSHVPPPSEYSANGHVRPYCLAVILERDKAFDDSHGAPRIAILFLCADGFAAYDALFCQDGNTRPPFAALIQDHGFGGNYDRFGKGGYLERIAEACGVWPEWILARDGAWEGYGMVEGVAGSIGGMHRVERRLWSIVTAAKR